MSANSTVTALPGPSSNRPATYRRRTKEQRELANQRRQERQMRKMGLDLAAMEAGVAPARGPGRPRKNHPYKGTMAQSANQALPLGTSAQLGAVDQIAASAPAQQDPLPAQHQQQQLLPVVFQQTGIPLCVPAGQECYYFAAPEGQASAPLPPTFSAPLAPFVPPAQQLGSLPSAPAEQQNLGRAFVSQGAELETSPNSWFDTSDEEFWGLTDTSSGSPPYTLGPDMTIDPRVLVKGGSNLMAGAPADELPNSFSVADPNITLSTEESGPRAEGETSWVDELGQPLGKEELNLLSIWG